jgi:hypothetical protein
MVVVVLRQRGAIQRVEGARGLRLAEEHCMLLLEALLIDVLRRSSGLRVIVWNFARRGCWLRPRRWWSAL